jgi:FlaG/FlaF family flagellin (archaellin)
MINSVNSVCDANCQQATGNVFVGYEPYYQQQLSDVQQNSLDTKGETNGNPQAIGVIYIKGVNENTKVISTSVQLPALCSGTLTGNCQLVPSGS